MEALEPTGRPCRRCKQELDPADLAKSYEDLEGSWATHIDLFIMHMVVTSNLCVSLQSRSHDTCCYVFVTCIDISLLVLENISNCADLWEDFCVRFVEWLTKRVSVVKHGRC